jgi:1,5-anhydro-D-fructose reductase (1,5-anhydro-D-mannitol-forming)
MSNTMDLRIGIIGYGKMGKTRHEAIQQVGKAVVVAFSEPAGVDIGLPNISHTEMINHPEIDAVVISTPNYLNKELTIACLQAGKHVFCEKPPAFTAADMDEIRQVEKNSKGRKLMYGFNHRHHDSVIKMKEIVHSGEFGKVLWMRGRYGKSVTEDYFNNWRAKKQMAGGGILLDQGIHMLDLFLHLGGNFDRVKAELSNSFWKLEVEDNAFVILHDTLTGMDASLHSTMTQWRHLFSLEVFLEKGYMVLNGLLTSSRAYGEEILTLAKNRSTGPAVTWADEVKIEYTDDNSWRYEIKHFIDAVENDTEIKIGNSDDALKLMRIIDKIYEEKEF